MKTLLEKLNASCENQVQFIQVGSNEGVLTNDPLCSFILKHPWKGILIEPVPRLFQKLQKNYKHRPDLHFEMVAISDTRKKCDFFVIDETAKIFQENPELIDQNGQKWGEQLGSFKKEHILDDRKYDPKLSSLQKLSEKEVKTIQVECVPLEDIVEKYQLQSIDLLHIDAEGHDDTILSAIDLSKIKPKMILFEHMHMSFERYCLCLIHLKIHGYGVVYTSGVDTLVARRDWGEKEGLTFSRF